MEIYSSIYGIVPLGSADQWANAVVDAGIAKNRRVTCIIMQK